MEEEWWCGLLCLLFLLAALILGSWLLLGDSDLTTFLLERMGADSRRYFDGKVIWITGASSGIGEALARRLAAHSKCRLILSARRVAELHRVKLACLESAWGLSDDDVSVFPLDLMNLDGLPAAAARAESIFGRLDVVIHNAGRSQRAEWDKVAVAVDEACMRLNTFAPVVLSRALLPSLLAQEGGGQIVLVSSISGVVGAPLSPSYTAAKHALNGYFRCLTLEAADKPLKVNIVCPALTYSPNNPATAFTEAAGGAYGQVLDGPSPNHMLPERAAALIASAAANDQAEAWLSHRKKVLLLAYLATISPGLARFVVRRIVGSAKLRRIRGGDE